MRTTLIPVAVALVALLALLAAVLTAGFLRTGLVLIPRHVPLATLLVSLILLSHVVSPWPLCGRTVESKLDAELIREKP